MDQVEKLEFALDKMDSIKDAAEEWKTATENLTNAFSEFSCEVELSELDLDTDTKNAIAKFLKDMEPDQRPPEETYDQDEREKEVEDHELLVVKKRPQRKTKKSEDSDEADWRLDPDDHIRSWMFIMEIAGVPADKNLWCDLGLRLDRFEAGLDEFCRI